MSSEENQVTILHFNDVYNIQEGTKEPVGGAARFSTAIKERSHLNPMIVFSGDAFNPSIMSSFFKGRQMVAVLNALNVDIAVYGNHDFDFGVDKVVKLVGETKFPWLLSNVVDNFTGEPLAEGKPHHIMEWNSKKIGFVGLVEKEWISTLSTIDPDDVTYLDFVEVGRDLVEELKEEGADYIIALTHMRWPNDTKLAEQVDGIDLILGGHDHDFNIKQVNGKYIIKSGTDFKFIGHITLEFKDDSEVKVDIEKVVIDKTFDEDLAVKEIVTSFSDKLGEKMNKVLGVLENSLDGRFSMVRTQETNLGNFIADIMLSATNADAVLLNGGTLRSDIIHPRGPFTMRDMMTILPFGGSAVVLEITGKQLLEALQIGVSQYPSHEGRFPQVAGMTYAFDPDLPPGERVVPKYISVQGNDLDMDKKYKLAVTDYLANGKDGYELLQDCVQLTPLEEGPVLHTIIQNHFQSIKVCRGEKKRKYAHHQAVLAINRMKSLVKIKEKLQTGNIDGISLTKSESDATVIVPKSAISLSASQSDNSESADVNSNKPNSNTGLLKKKGFYHVSRMVMNLNTAKRAAFLRQESRDVDEKEALPKVLTPCVEGRITILTREKRIELDRMKEEDLGEHS